MRRNASSARFLIAFAGALLAAVPAAAQNFVVDGNIFWDNDGGSYATAAADTGGWSCPGGTYTTTKFATVYFHNQTIDPMLNPQVYNLSNPRWDPQAGSPALAGNPNSRVLDAHSLDPWFQNVCYAGAVPYTGGDDSKDWTTGWTYYNMNGGLGRTDIDTTKTAVMVTADITANTTWTSSNNYYLIGRIAVDPPATLTIDPGTVIMGGGVGSFLVIERGAQINAQGTREQPIVFTSGSRWQDGLQAPGDWGGVVLHGRAVANCVGGCGLTTGGDCVSEGDVGALFGGNDDNDSSGIIRYARVEYAGETISPDNELNSWTQNALGANTTLEYLQAWMGTDDAFEWFGGVGHLRYAVATAADDDNVDWQMGFRGRVQFVVVKQYPNTITPNADCGIEADNNEFDYSCPLASNPIISNVTFVGCGPLPGGVRGIRLRRGTAGTVINCIVQGFSNVGLRLEDHETYDHCAGVAPPELACDVLAVGDQMPVRGQNLIVRAAPNPTTGPASLSFALGADQHVTVDVFSVTGRLVDRVMDGLLGAGQHTIEWNPAGVSPGLYFYKVKTGGQTATGKLVVSR